MITEDHVPAATAHSGPSKLISLSALGENRSRAKEIESLTAPENRGLEDRPVAKAPGQTHAGQDVRPPPASSDAWPGPEQAALPGRSGWDGRPSQSLGAIRSRTGKGPPHLLQPLETRSGPPHAHYWALHATYYPPSQLCGCTGGLQLWSSPETCSRKGILAKM